MATSPDDKREAEELEKEIRRGRKFTIAEAIGRMAGPGMMKGVSPISGKQQADAIIEDVINRLLVDNQGALKSVIIRQLKASSQLLTRFHEPIQVLQDVLQHLLHSEYHLKELVRDADVEWGQMNDVRPHFEREGFPPDPDDPYTFESVKKTLESLLKEISS
ncbi:MAG: hypothetical protein JNJ77_15910 [Planctomycetia bacterium]|nr:hypothetical protein [Planctomycetia bacterium]